MGGRHGRCFDDELAFMVFLILILLILGLD